MPPKKEKVKESANENKGKKEEEFRDFERDAVLKDELTRLEAEYEEIKKRVNEL
jgi:hypothetical protein